MTAETEAPGTAPTISERDMLGALELLTTAAEDPDVFLILSDEEILGLDGRPGLEILGSPYLDQDGVDLEASGAAALRSLIARRLVNPLAEGREDEGEYIVGEGDPGARTLQLDRALAGVLTLRRIPEAMVITTRTSADVGTKLAHYLFPGDGVLEEFVAADGFHHFCLPERGAVETRIHDFVDPHQAAAEDGPVRLLTAENIEAELPEISDTRTLSVITAAAENEGYQTSVFALSDRVLVLNGGSIADAEAESPTAEWPIGAVSSDSLQAVIARLVPRIVADDAEASQDEN